MLALLRKYIDEIPECNRNIFNKLLRSYEELHPEYIEGVLCKTPHFSTSVVINIFTIIFNSIKYTNYQTRNSISPIAVAIPSLANNLHEYRCST
jgi:hypothetical protein